MNRAIKAPDNHGSNQMFRDKEIIWFYWIIFVIFGITFLLVFADREWPLSLLMIGIILAFAYFGWPLKALVVNQHTVVFKNLLRSVQITPDNILTVKATGPHDYRAHIVIRTRKHIPIGYRCRQFENSSVLAQHILQLIEQAPQAKVTPEVMKLLKQVASGNTNSLKEEKV